MLENNFAQTGRLLRINLHRDWLKLTLWFVGLAGLMVGYAGGIGALFSDQAAKDALIQTLRTPAMVAVIGYLPEHVTLTDAVMFSSEMLVFMGLLYGLASLLVSVNVTRGDEEQGLVEVIRAKAVGRQAVNLAAFLEVLVFNLTLFVVVGAGLQIVGMQGANTSGNWLASGLLAAIGVAFGSLGILMAQVSGEARSATAGGIGLLGLAYVLRMLLDVSHPEANWWSLLGWIEQGGAYYNNNWGPFWMLLAVAVVLLGGAFVLDTQRDLGAGLIAARSGHARSWFLRGPLTALIKSDARSCWAWLIGALAIGAMYGSIFNNVAEVISTNKIMQQVLNDGMRSKAANGLIISFMVTLSIVLTIMGTLRGQGVMNRLATDAHKGYIELFSARAIGRWRLFATYAGYALVNAWLTLGAGIYGLYLGSISVMKNPLAAKYFWRLFVGYGATVAVMVAISALLVAFVPRLKGLAYLYAAVGFVMMYFRSIFRLKDWVVKLVPYGWMKNLPGKAVNMPTFWLMLLITAAIFAVAYLGYRHRDQLAA